MEDLIIQDNGFSVEYYSGKQIVNAFVKVSSYEHITLRLDKGLVIVETDQDIKFSCHSRDFIALRY